MSGDRYEIGSKIGEGAGGAVYQAFDRQLNREVAIKRIRSAKDSQDQERPAESFLEKSKALRALKHPNLATIYDLGIDEDGPFVVMELLNGSSLADMISRGPLTYDDFVEVAMQSQEGLIAAHEHKLIHGNLKPGNVMITWPPEGVFQLKLMEFALAGDTPQVSIDTATDSDPIPASLYFRAPEQIQGGLPDKRSDIYSMGCIYYYSLTGQVPFDGDSLPQVIQAHLQHVVNPLDQLRPDLPEWLLKWVMWQIARDRNARPSDAREALQVFQLGEEGPNHYPKVSQPTIQPIPIVPPEEPKNSPDKSNPLPGTEPTHAKGEQGVVPNEPAAPRRPQLIVGNAVASAPKNPDPPAETPVLVDTPIPAKPRLVTGVPATPPPPSEEAIAAESPAETPPLVQAASPTAPPMATGQRPGAIPPAPTPGVAATTSSGNSLNAAIARKKGMSSAVKAVIASILAVIVILAGIVLMDMKRKSDQNAELNKIGAYFADPNNPPTSVPLKRAQLDLLLSTLSTPGMTEEGDRATFLEALRLGTSADGTNLDAEIAEYATETPMDSGVRQKLFQVLGARGSDSALKDLIEFASTTDDSDAGKAALKATRRMATRDNFESLLNIIKKNPDSGIRNTAVDTLSSVIKRAGDPRVFSEMVVTSFKNSTDQDAKIALLRLAGSSGGDDTAGLIKDAFEGQDAKMKIAAIYALRSWPDTSQFETLLNYTEQEQDPDLRKQAFNSLTTFLNDGPEIKESELLRLWKKAADISKGTGEQVQVIDSLARHDQPWAIALIESFLEKGDSDQSITRAERALELLETNRKGAEDPQEEE